MAGILYIVGTPIGNLGDMSPRAVETLSVVDFIAAEDTRVTLKLLNHFDIKKPMISYFEHNRREKGEVIVGKILAGETCALVTDAGMPAVSDPGEDLCRLCHENGISVVPIPGCSAAIAALSASGMPSKRFTFEGFLPREKKEQEELFEELITEKRTMIFYEAPHRLLKTLTAFLEGLGNRELCIARELTKINEEIIRTTLSDAVNTYKDKEPRGEYVLIIGGSAGENADVFWENLTVDEHVDFYINQGLKKMDAIKKVAKDRGVPKNDIYRELL